ncbi:hypothetical protein HYDPIDRAFT_112400 [Hydnomerulius pinastri MD-312]|uniref:Uncharacterized protein n=1 Tax=Hydnomerulius pinastri MD-312 TaxID=994086 RepID=A0A0C9W3Q2_9AGAM|nr:hypothetical protein HYDPIDRAFT_116558 [Hydnomerulius pinastri MD-312]KIJ64390.1 hypothetical protein HYDPIDRAFT_112400 [Hydnomerulius pinastri MD-312]
MASESHEAAKKGTNPKLGGHDRGFATTPRSGWDAKSRSGVFKVFQRRWAALYLRESIERQLKFQELGRHILSSSWRLKVFRHPTKTGVIRWKIF